jgi:amino acid transporter
MADETPSIQRAEQVDHQLVRGIGIPALTANIVSSTIGAGIFVIPATVAAGLGPAAPMAFICCAIAMVLFVTCFAIAGSRVSLTGGLYAYVEVAFGKYVGFLAGMLYFLTALGAVAGVVNVLANSIALVIPFLGGPLMRIVVMLTVYGVQCSSTFAGCAKARAQSRRSRSRNFSRYFCSLASESFSLIRKISAGPVGPAVKRWATV